MSSSKQTPLMFFYLKVEEQDTGEGQPSGLLRVVDLSNDSKKTITVLEVSQIRETFSFLKKRLTKVGKKTSHSLNSEYGICIMWNEKVARDCLGSNIPWLVSLAEDIQLRVGLRRLSKRLLAVK